MGAPPRLFFFTVGLSYRLGISKETGRYAPLSSSGSVLRRDHLTGGRGRGLAALVLHLSLPDTVLIPSKTTFIQ
jgi:hypothetical protein